MRDHIKYFLVTLIVLWLLGFLYIFSNNTNNINAKNSEINLNDEDRSSLQDRVRKAESDLAELQSKNKINQLLIQNLRNQADEYLEKLKKSSNFEIQKNPSQLSEDTRRKVFSDVKDVSYFINSQINGLKQDKKLPENLKDKLDFVTKNFQDRINVLIAEVYNLSISDSLGDWRRAQSIQLRDKVNSEFLELQNPRDCESRKKIICDLNKSCGFGCQMHHVMYCFITAYFMNRTMILESSKWSYNSNGYEAYFKPVSDSCKISNDPSIGWNDYTPEVDAKSIRMPIIDVINNKPRFLPLSVPKSYLEDLSRLHGEPFVWWAGQVLSYLMRFNSEFNETVQKARNSLKFETPCVGVHVRRTDKVGTEAAFHGLEEYMKHVKDFYEIYDLKNSVKSKRIVYLATDEVTVLEEARKSYKDYTFLMDEKNAKTASLNQRYSPESAQGVILDIHFLSQCDYLVCTFSSQVCRMAFELMQPRFPDASWRFRSLDDVYYYGGQNGHNVQAIYDHVPRRDLGEIELKKGDLISLAGNHWDGYSKGKNLKNSEEGLFPSYKVIDFIESY